MDRRRFLRNLGLGGITAWFFSTMPAAVASTLESCHQALSDIRDIALGPGKPKDRLDAIVAIVDGELGPIPTSIEGDFAGVIPAGETWKITGDVNLTGDLIVEGTLTGIDTFTVEGNGHQILVQNGGRLDLAGKPKTGWVNWGDPVNWNVGDSLVVAPTAVGDYTTKTATWQGDWSTTLKPSADVTLVDGSIARPEVANLSQTARIHNVSRVMFHMGAGVQSLSSVAAVDSGLYDVTDFYPLHFHLNGESVRGSTFTDVVVVGGQHHSFVPHESNGITFTRCAAVNGHDTSFWWNRFDFSNDITYDRCLALGQQKIPRGAGTRYHSFRLGRGTGNRSVGCVAAGQAGGQYSGAFLWPEADSDDWIFTDGVAHNNDASGIVHYTTNGDVDGLVSYRNKYSGIQQLTYRNRAKFSRMVLAGNVWGLTAKGVSDIPGLEVFTDVVTDTNLGIGSSQATAEEFVEVIRASFPGGVTVNGAPSDTSEPTRGRLLWRFTDCGLSPADFDMIGDGGPLSVFSIVESGAEVHRYENNGWSF